MDQIIVDNSFTRQMPAALEPCLVFDSTGKRLGCFIPEVDPSIYQGMNASVSDDELDRRERAGGGRTLDEVVNGLRKRS
jgi:hypothetical protein